MPRTKKTNTATKYYKILNPDMTPCHGGSGKYFKPTGKRPGKWMPYTRIVPCQSGYHVAEVQDIPRWLKLNAVVWLCEPSDTVVRHESTKSVSESVRLIRKVGVLDMATLVKFARLAADQVKHLCYDTAAAYARAAYAAAAAAAAADAAYAAAYDTAAAADAAYAAAYDTAAAAADAYAYAAAAAAADAAYAYAAAYAAYAAAYDTAAAADAAYAAAYDTAAAAADAERRWQGERLLTLLTEQE